MAKPARAWEVVVRLPQAFEIEINDLVRAGHPPGVEIVIPFNDQESADGAATGITVGVRPGQPGILQGEVIHDHDQ
jgi:hypothetical protein